jgi:hypothetical protein
VNAQLDPTGLSFALRFASVVLEPWVEAGRAIAVFPGPGRMRGAGSVTAGGALSLTLSRALPSTPTQLAIGRTATCLWAFPGVAIARRDLLIPIAAGANRSWSKQVNLPGNIMPGTSLYLQAW